MHLYSFIEFILIALYNHHMSCLFKILFLLIMHSLYSTKRKPL